MKLNLELFSKRISFLPSFFSKPLIILCSLKTMYFLTGLSIRVQINHQVPFCVSNTINNFRNSPMYPRDLLDFLNIQNKSVLMYV